MYELFHAPGACSMGIQILLEEIGAPYELNLLDLAKGEPSAPPYLAINPKGKVPALRVAEGELLTEFQTIAFWLAETHPEAGLMPNDTLGRARVMEAMDYMIGTVHMRGFTLALVPMKLIEGEACQGALRNSGLAVARQGLDRLSDMLGEKPWLLGDFTLADAVLFYLVAWARHLGMEAPASLSAHNARMMERPAVARAMTPR